MCQVKDGKGKSMGTGDFEVKERRMIFKNGTVGCSEIARQTEVFFFFFFKPFFLFKKEFFSKFMFPFVRFKSAAIKRKHASRK